MKRLKKSMIAWLSGLKKDRFAAANEVQKRRGDSLRWARRGPVVLDRFPRIAFLILIGLLLLAACAKEEPTAVDTQAPTVEVTFPNSNTAVSQLVIITIEAQDNEEVVRVELYIDGILRFTDEDAPWEYSWETIGYANGSKHSIMAKAYDQAGNSGSSQEINVVVYNEINAPPTAVVILPEDSSSFVFGEQILLVGEGRDAQGTVLSEDQLAWFARREGYSPVKLGTGTNLTVDTLSAGWLTVTLIVTDDRLLTGRDSTVIQISDEATLNQVTFDGSIDKNPCWSPNGQQIAFCSNRLGNDDIFVTSAEGEYVMLETLTVDPSPDWDPAWYGSEIVFTSFRSGNADIWKMPDSGGEPQQMTTHQGWDTGASWSYNGEELVISSQMGGAAQHLWILPLDGSEPIELTTEPAYAPDWLWGDIAFHSLDRDIYVTTVAGLVPVRITVDPARDTSPSWSPYGDAIVFTSDRAGNEDIWIWSFIEGEFEQLTFHSERDYDPDWSPDGRWIAFTSERSGNPDIWVIQVRP
jgi:hypothetical protein